MNINWTGITIKSDSGINTYAGLKTAGTDLNLQPGQVCQGKVLGQAGENLYVVQVDGKNTLIQSPYRMEANSTITFQVEGQKDGQYMVRLYHGQEGQDVLIQNILKQLNLKDSPLLRELIKGFVAQELPLKPELLKQAERLAQKLGGNTPENIHIAILSLKTGITEQSGVMDALRLYFSGLGKTARGSEYQLSALLEKLGDVLAVKGESAPAGTVSGTATATQVVSKPVSLTPEGTHIFNQLRDMLQSVVLKPGEGAETVAAQIKNLISAQLPRFSAGGTQTVFSGVDEIIHQTGIEDTPLNRAIVQGFLSREIPLKAELLLLAENMVQLLGPNKPENIDTVLTLLQKSPAPESAGNTGALNSFSQGSEPAAVELTLKLSAFMQNLSGLLDSPGETVPRQTSGNLPGIQLSPEGDDLFRQLFNYFQAAARPGNVAPGRGNEVADILTAVKLLADALENRVPAPEGEKDILSAAPAQNQAAGTVPRPGASGNSGDINPSTQALSGKEYLLDTALLKNRGFSELLEGFSQLLQEVRKAAQEAGNPPQLQRLLQEGAMIERQMAGHQIYQSFVREYNQQNYLYFNIPFVQNGETEKWGQLRIIREGDRSKTIDPKNFGVALFLNTDNLGTLLVELKVREKDVTAGGRVTDDWVAGLLTGAWPQLQEAMAAAGYRLQPCRWRVGPVNENLRPVFTEQSKTAHPSFKLQSLNVTI